MGEPLKNEDALWREVRSTQKELNLQAIDHAKTKGKVELLESRIDTMAGSLADHRAESKNGFTRIESLFDSFSGEMKQMAIELAEKRGAGISRREMFAWACGAATLAGALMTAAKYFL